MIVVKPHKRLTLDQIRKHAFFDGNELIPSQLPEEYLCKAPSEEYLNENSNHDAMGNSVYGVPKMQLKLKEELLKKVELFK